MGRVSAAGVLATWRLSVDGGMIGVGVLPMTEAALKRRIRQRVQGLVHPFVLVCSPGFEQETRDECREAGLGDPEIRDPGTLAFSGRLLDGWRACLVLATVNRVRVEVAAGRARAPEDGFRIALEVPWEAWLPPRTVLHLQATTRRSRVFGGGFLGRLIREAVDRRFRECPERRPRWLEDLGDVAGRESAQDLAWALEDGGGEDDGDHRPDTRSAPERDAERLPRSGDASPPRGRGRDSVDQGLGDCGNPDQRQGGTGGGVQRLVARLSENRLTLALDLGGEPLHRRGLRLRTSEAPLRETLVAALLRRAEWRPGMTLVEGFAGDAPFLAEAAARDRGLPPGRARDFAFQQWPSYREGAFRHLREQVLGAALPRTRSRLIAVDRAPLALRRAREHLDRAGVGNDALLLEEDFFRWDPPPGAPPGVLCLNPPYGRRMGVPDALGLYRRLGEVLRSRWRGWRVVVIGPSPSHCKALSLPGARGFPLPHGGLPAQVVIADLSG